MVYNHTIYTTLLTNRKPFLVWTMMICNHIIYTAVKQQVLHVCTIMVYNHTIYTLQAHTVVTLQAHTVTIYNHFLHYQTVHLYKLAQ